MGCTHHGSLHAVFIMKTKQCSGLMSIGHLENESQLAVHGIIYMHTVGAYLSASRLICEGEMNPLRQTLV